MGPELQQPATISEENPLPDIAPAADEEQQDDLQDDLNKKKMKGGHLKGSTDARYEWFKWPGDAPLPNWKGELLRR